MPRYIVSPEAQKSLKQIGDYTLENFGKKQTTLYLKAFRDRMRMLTKAPLTGKSRDDIKTGYYSYFEGSHTIYYRIRHTHIDIIDVLHQSMEPTKHL